MLWSTVDKETLETRDENDFYATDVKDVTKSLHKVDNCSKINTVLDLCCGYGTWGAVWKTHFNKESVLTGCDIQSFENNLLFDNLYYDFDVLQYLTKDIGTFDLVISNPPFKYAQECIELSYDLLNEGGQMLMLLRLNFLESLKREKFFDLYKPTNVWVFRNRPKFYKNNVKYKGTYPTAYGLFKWVKKYNYTTELGWF